MNANLKPFGLYWLFFLIMGIALFWQHRERQHREAVAESLCATAEVGSEFFNLGLKKATDDQVLNSIRTSLRTHIKHLEKNADNVDVNKERRQLEATLFDFRQRVLFVTDSLEFTNQQFDHFFANAGSTFQKVFDTKDKLNDHEIALWSNSFCWRIDLFLQLVFRELGKVMAGSNPIYPRNLFPETRIESQTAPSSYHVGDTVTIGVYPFAYCAAIWNFYYVSRNGEKVPAGQNKGIDTILFQGQGYRCQDTMWIQTPDGESMQFYY